MGHAELLAEILADPASEAARLVYADALIDAGNPRGEFIQLQCRFEQTEWNDPERRTLDERIADLLAIYEDVWTRDVRALGFTEHLQQVTLRRGFVEKVSIGSFDLVRRVRALRAITPLRELQVVLDDPSHVDSIGSVACDLDALAFRAVPPSTARVLAQRFPHWPHRGALTGLHVPGPVAHAIAETPALRGLQRLRIETIGTAGIMALAGAPHVATVETLELPHSNMRDEGLLALARSPHSRALRHLQLEHAGVSGAAVGALGAIPLERLRIHHNAIGERGARELATRFPALELLDVEACDLGGEALRALLASPALPELASLELSRNPVADAALAAAIDALALPSLRHLVCAANGVGAATARALARSPRLDELRSLDVSENPLGDDGVLALVDAAVLRRLEMLRIEQTTVGERGLRALGASPLGAGLRALDLGRNQLGDDELHALLDADRLVALESLALAGAALSARGVTRLVSSPIAGRLKHLTLGGLAEGALAPLLSAALPQLRSLVADRFDDDAARTLARARGLPKLHSLVLSARALTDAGARALAESPQLQRILWLELDAPALTDLGRTLLRARFGHHVAVRAPLR